jgi:hypothetical protein
MKSDKEKVDDFIKELKKMHIFMRQNWASNPEVQRLYKCMKSISSMYDGGVPVGGI